MVKGKSMFTVKIKGNLELVLSVWGWN